MFNLETIVVKFATDLAGYNAGLAQAQSNFQQTTSRINNLAIGAMTAQQAALDRTAQTYNQIASRITMIGTALGAGIVTGLLVKATAQFDETMANTMAIMEGGSDAIRAQMESVALSLSTKSVTSANELAKAYEQLTRQGYSAAQSIAALSTVERFSAISGMSTGNTARDLARLMRALDLETTNAVDNAKNMRHVGDIVASVSMSAGVGTEQFMHSIMALAPSLRFLNKDLEEGVALLAAYTSSGVEAGQAAKMSQQLLANLGLIYTKHEEIIHTTIRTNIVNRAGGAGGNVSSNMANRAFGGNLRRAAGIAPLHDVNQAVNVATQAWTRYGLELYDVDGNMHSLVHIMRQFDTVLGEANDQQRALILTDLGFQRQTIQSIISLLGSTEAMQGFYLQAKRADGILDDIYNKRLLSFNAQFKILRNNIEVAAISIGRTLLPALLWLNTALIVSLGYWHTVPGPLKTVIGYMLLIVGAALNTLLTVMPILMRFAFGIGALSNLRGMGILFFGLWKLLKVVGLGFYYLGYAASAGSFLIMYPLLRILMILGRLATIGLPLVGFLYRLLITCNLLKLSVMGIGTFFRLWNGWLSGIIPTMFVMLVQSKLMKWIWAGMSANAYTLSIRAAATAVQGLRIAWTSLTTGIRASTKAMLAFDLASLPVWGTVALVIALVTGLILFVAWLQDGEISWRSFGKAITTVLLIVIALLAVPVIAIGFIIASVILLTKFIANSVGAVTDFGGAWKGAENEMSSFFWLAVGYMHNFQENWSLLMDWLDNNTWNVWQDLATGIRGVLITIELRTLEGMKWVINKIRDMITTLISDIVTIFAGLAINNPRIANALGIGVPEMNALLAFQRALNNLEPFKLFDLGIEDLQKQLLALEFKTQPIPVNFQFPESVRNTIQNMPNRLRHALDGLEMPDAGAKNIVGDTFKELAPRRFILDSNIGTSGPNRPQQVNDPGVIAQLAEVLNVLRIIGNQGGLPVVME